MQSRQGAEEFRNFYNEQSQINTKTVIGDMIFVMIREVGGRIFDFLFLLLFEIKFCKIHRVEVQEVQRAY